MLRAWWEEQIEESQDSKGKKARKNFDKNLRIEILILEYFKSSRLLRSRSSLDSEDILAVKCIKISWQEHKFRIFHYKSKKKVALSRRSSTTL